MDSEANRVVLRQCPRKSGKSPHWPFLNPPTGGSFHGRLLLLVVVPNLPLEEPGFQRLSSRLPPFPDGRQFLAQSAVMANPAFLMRELVVSFLLSRHCSCRLSL